MRKTFLSIAVVAAALVLSHVVTADEAAPGASAGTGATSEKATRPSDPADPSAKSAHADRGEPQRGHPGRPDPKKLFAKMDKDNDGKLTVEEFTEGLKEVHKTMMEHRGQRGRMAWQMPRGPMYNMMPPRGGPGMWMDGMGPGPRGEQGPGMRGPGADRRGAGWSEGWGGREGRGPGPQWRGEGGAPSDRPRMEGRGPDGRRGAGRAESWGGSEGRGPGPQWRGEGGAPSDRPRMDGRGPDDRREGRPDQDKSIKERLAHLRAQLDALEADVKAEK